MKQRNRSTLRVWKPTGYREGSTFRTAWRVLSSQVFFIGVAIISLVVMVYFRLMNEWRIWVIPVSSIGLATLAILLRRRGEEKLPISNRQAEKYNRFQYAARFLPNRYLNLIDLEAERSQDDDIASIAMYRHLGAALVTLGLYEETGLARIKPLKGDELQQIAPVEFYTDFILASGIAYILFESSVSLLPKISSVDERIISRVLRESGIVGWKVERISFDDDVVLFILKDESISRAYDFSEAE